MKRKDTCIGSMKLGNRHLDVKWEETYYSETIADEVYWDDCPCEIEILEIGFRGEDLKIKGADIVVGLIEENELMPTVRIKGNEK